MRRIAAILALILLTAAAGSAAEDPGGGEAAWAQGAVGAAPAPAVGEVQTVAPPSSAPRPRPDAALFEAIRSGFIHTVQFGTHSAKSEEDVLRAGRNVLKSGVIRSSREFDVVYLFDNPEFIKKFDADPSKEGVVPGMVSFVFGPRQYVTRATGIGHFPKIIGSVKLAGEPELAIVTVNLPDIPSDIRASVDSLNAARRAKGLYDVEVDTLENFVESYRRLAGGR